MLCYLDQYTHLGCYNYNVSALVYASILQVPLLKLRYLGISCRKFYSIHFKFFLLQISVLKGYLIKLARLYRLCFSSTELECMNFRYCQTQVLNSHLFGDSICFIQVFKLHVALKSRRRIRSKLCLGLKRDIEKGRVITG